MQRKTLFSLAIAMLLTAGGSAWAQQGQGRYDDHGRGQHAQPRHGSPGWQAHDPYRGDERRHPGRGAGPRHDMVKGARLPAEYRGRHYVVNDWRRHHLSAPPRGHRWIQAGSDYVLVANATNLIVRLVLY
ncbi:MAG: RcnB family protein [Noviherbaspirillum sp.]